MDKFKRGLGMMEHFGNCLAVLFALQTARMPEERTDLGIVPSGLHMLTTAACSYNISQIPDPP